MDNPCRVRPTGDDGDNVVADDADDDDDHDDDDDDNDPDVEDDDDPPPEQQAPSMQAADQVENIRSFFKINTLPISIILTHIGSILDC